MGISNETAITVQRSKLGMTQAEAAAKAGISIATWRRFEQSPGLGYRGDTIRGVLRALKMTRDELQGLLGDEQPTVANLPTRTAWIGPWNELWRNTSWPSITPRMAAALQVSLDMAGHMLESEIESPNFDPEESLVLGKLDPRIFIEVGENKAWFRAVARRLQHLVDSMDEGKLIDESCECFADAVLFSAAVRDAADGWEDSCDIFPEVSDALPSQVGECLGTDDDTWDADPDERWSLFEDDMDDRMPYREWDCAFPEYRKTRHLINHRPPKTWFDEPDHELETFRRNAPYNILVQELMDLPPSRAEVWMDDRRSDEQEPKEA